MGIISVCSDKGWLSWDCAKALVGIYKPHIAASPLTAICGCTNVESEKCKTNSTPTYPSGKVEPLSNTYKKTALASGATVGWLVDLKNCDDSSENIYASCQLIFKNQQDPFEPKIATVNSSVVQTGQFKGWSLIKTSIFAEFQSDPICDIHHYNPNKPDKRPNPVTQAITLRKPEPQGSSCFKHEIQYPLIKDQPANGRFYVPGEKIKVRAYRSSIGVCETKAGQLFSGQNLVPGANGFSATFKDGKTTTSAKHDHQYFYLDHLVHASKTASSYPIIFEVKYGSLNPATQSTSIVLRNDCYSTLPNPTISQSPGYFGLPLKQMDGRVFTYSLSQLKDNDQNPLVFVSHNAATKFLSGYKFNYDSIKTTATIAGQFMPTLAYQSGPLQIVFKNGCYPAQYKTVEISLSIQANQLSCADNIDLGQNLACSIKNEAPQAVTYKYQVYDPDGVVTYSKDNLSTSKHTLPSSAFKQTGDHLVRLSINAVDTKTYPIPAKTVRVYSKK